MSGTGNRIVASSSALPTGNQMFADRNHMNNNYQSKQSMNTVQGGGQPDGRIGSGTNFQSKASLGTVQGGDHRQQTQPFSTKGSSAQHPPQMMVQPNLPMQHYATSGGPQGGHPGQVVPR